MIGGYVNAGVYIFPFDKNMANYHVGANPPHNTFHLGKKYNSRKGGGGGNKNINFKFNIPV